MVSPAEYYDNVNLSNVPLPDWSHLGVTSPTSNPTIKLNWDQVYIDDVENNSTKEEPHTPAEIEALKLSFSAGVKDTEYPPAVSYRGKQYAQPWQLEYGFGRAESLRLLQTKGWVFTVLDGDEDSIEDVKAQENELLPKRVNEEIDMRKFLISKVITGKIEKTEKAIRSKFKKVYSYRPKEVENRVVPQVLKELGVKSPYIIYTSAPKAQDWIKNHSKIDYVITGDYDKERDMYGVLMKEGYQRRVVINAYKTYQETGKYTAVIFHCGAPTKKADFNTKRKQVVDGFNDIKKCLKYAGVKIWPIKILGALPQDKKLENLKELVIV
tara:strand:- start:1938 stop:2912 length:975 start_codon:yes stop_codon:yes gene_type:complete